MSKEQNMAAEAGMPDEPVMSDEEMNALEEARQAAKDAEIAPFRAAAQQRQHNATIVAEHDDLLADMLYEMTMNEIGTEV